MISGSVTGSYDGNTFTPGYGFATLDMMGNPLIGIAEAKVHCGSEKMANPPPGSGIIISVSSFAPGSYPDAFVTVYRNANNNFNALGSMGDVTLTAGGATIAGTLTFNSTDPSTGVVATASGSFEVTNCMP